MGRDKLDLPMRGVVRRYLEGHSTRKLARLYGCQAGTIARRLRQKGCALRPYHRVVGIEDVRALHALGYSHERMAHLLGSSSSTVGRLMAAAGLKSWGHSSRRRDTDYAPRAKRRIVAIEDVRALHALGYSQSQMAMRLGSCSSTVGRVALAAGLMSPRGGPRRRDLRCTIDDVRILRAMGLRYHHMARLLAVTLGTVYRRMAKLGLPPRGTASGHLPGP